MVRIGLGLTLALLLAAGSAAASASAAAIVSLGDSFISGEGGRWLGNGSEPFGTRSGTDRAAFDCDEWGICEYDPARVYGASEESGCHRSDLAPIRSAPVAGVARVNLACSGAREANVWPAALARRQEVRMVVLSVGANDVGFGGLVAGCALDWARSSGEDPVLCFPGAEAGLERTLPAMESGLEKALRGIRGVLAAAGYRRSEYRLVAMGYASPFPSGRWFRYPQDDWSRLEEGGCPVWDADADWAAGAGIGAIDAAMRAAAAATGAEFLDLRHALDGHQLCDRRSRRVGSEGPSARSAEWVRRLSLVQGSSRESLHPNAYGQRAIGACLGLLYTSAPGDYACRDTPGRGTAAMRIEPLSRG